MPGPNWRTLLAASAIFTIHAANLRATPPNDNTPAYRPISFPEFQKLVWAGEEIRSRLLPSEFITRVLEDADENLMQHSHDARLRLRSCKVTDGAVRPKKPTRDIQVYPEEIRKHLGGENKRPVYLALTIHISHTDFDADLYLDDVVIERRITLEDVDFRQSVYFQGAVFMKPLVLTRTRFHGVTDFSRTFLEKTALSFNDCEFELQANFANLTVPNASKLYIGGDHISAPLDFSGSQISGALTLSGRERTLQVDHIVYLNGVNGGVGVPVGKLSLKDIEFHDNVYMDQSKWAQLDLAESAAGRHRPIRFLGFCDFRNGLFDTVDLGGAEFDRGGDFSDSVFRTAVSFERTKLRQPVRMKWCQLRGKLRPVAPSGKTSDKLSEGRLSVPSYEELERNFQKLGDLDSQNECNYDKRWKHEGMNLAWLISGYWVVWWVPLLWVLGSLLTFYWINRKRFDQHWFGLRKPAATARLIPEPWALTAKTTFRLLLPNEYWGTPQGQRLYLLESVWLKIFLGIFIFTIKNTSSLLRDLLPYLLPK